MKFPFAFLFIYLFINELHGQKPNSLPDLAIPVSQEPPPSPPPSFLPFLQIILLSGWLTRGSTLRMPRSAWTIYTVERVIIVGRYRGSTAEFARCHRDEKEVETYISTRIYIYRV